MFAGYWNNDAGDRRGAGRDGWFHTGDIGALDDDGYLRITGRKKEIIVTAGGKNVAPAVLEDRIRAHPLVSQCMVVGDGQPFIAALSPSTPRRWCRWVDQHGKPPATHRSPSCATTRVLAEVQRRSTTPTRPSPRPSRSEVPDPAGRLHRGERAPDPVAEAQAQRRVRDFAKDVDALYG